MPYWFETQKIKLPKAQDKRRKLTDKDKEKIKQMYEDGLDIREIAKKFEKKVCRRSIQFILFPERKKKQNWKDFYDRKKHTIAMRKHRKHKKEILGYNFNHKNKTKGVGL